MDHLVPMATMGTMSGANGCSIGANGDSVSDAIGDHNRHWRQWRHPLAPMAIAIGDHWRHLNGAT